MGLQASLLPLYDKQRRPAQMRQAIRNVLVKIQKAKVATKTL
jgi:hypothetical protein